MVSIKELKERVCKANLQKRLRENDTNTVATLAKKSKISYEVNEVITLNEQKFLKTLKHQTLNTNNYDVKNSYVIRINSTNETFLIDVSTPKRMIDLKNYFGDSGHTIAIDMSGNNLYRVPLFLDIDCMDCKIESCAKNYDSLVYNQTIRKIVNNNVAKILGKNNGIF